MTIVEVPDPIPAGDEVLIDVAAAGVNRADLLQRQGNYPPPRGASPYLGLECSGRIAAVGPDVERWHVGDEVCALLSGGAYAERVTVPWGQVMPVPRGTPLVEAAALPEATCTVWSNLVMAAHLGAGDTVLIHGGGSGIGTMAIQVARLVGARPIVTVGSTRKAAVCTDLGAEAVINYREGDFVDEVRTITDGRGVDVVLDIIGAKYLASNLKSLASDGRLVVIGLQGGVRADLDLGRLLAKRLSVIGTTLRSRSHASKASIVSEVVAHVWPAIEQGTVRSVINQVLPFNDVAKSHELLESGESVGKVILQVS